MGIGDSPQGLDAHDREEEVKGLWEELQGLCLLQERREGGGANLLERREGEGLTCWREGKGRG